MRIVIGLVLLVMLAGCSDSRMTTLLSERNEITGSLDEIKSKKVAILKTFSDGELRAVEFFYDEAKTINSRPETEILVLRKLKAGLTPQHYSEYYKEVLEPSRMLISRLGGIDRACRARINQLETNADNWNAMQGCSVIMIYRRSIISSR